MLGVWPGGGGGGGGAGVDGSLGAEQPWEQRLLSTSVFCSLGSRAGVLRGATQTLGTERGRGPEGSFALSTVFAARTQWKVL